jgi:hypothetical protein
MKQLLAHLQMEILVVVSVLEILHHQQIFLTVESSIICTLNL